jgi:hypothetical protein
VNHCSFHKKKLYCGYCVREKKKLLIIVKFDYYRGFGYSIGDVLTIIHGLTCIYRIRYRIRYHNLTYTMIQHKKLFIQLSKSLLHLTSMLELESV